jgi:hypothetical protein
LIADVVNGFRGVWTWGLGMLQHACCLAAPLAQRWQAVSLQLSTHCLPSAKVC